MELNNLIIRIACISDIEEITQLFYDTIQYINSKDYPQDQIDDWASWHTDTEKWAGKLLQQYFIVAIFDNIVVGFSSLATDGYLDFMFVHKNYQNRGIAGKLLRVIEEKAIDQNNESVYSDVSITARPFFESHGYKVEKQQLKQSRIKSLINFRMIKNLNF